MEREKINYLKIRKVYEHNNSQEKLDILVINYCNQMAKDQIERPDPVLEDVTISEEAISKLSTDGILALLISNANPKEKLVESVLDRIDALESALFLYNHGIIVIEQVQETILTRGELLTHIRKLISLNNPELYAKLDLGEIERMFISDYILGTSNFYINYLEEALFLLEFAPYNPNHITLVGHIKAGLVFETPGKKKELYVKLDAFSKKLIFGKLKGNDLINNLYMRPDYKKMLDILRHSPWCDSTEEKQKKQSMMDEIIALIESGTLDRPAFAMCSFSQIYDSRIKILNYWAEHDKDIEIEIYGNAFISDPYDIFNMHADEYDEKYIQAKNQTLIEETKNHQMKPVTD